MHYIILNNILGLLAATMDVDTAIGKLLGLIVKFGWVGGVGLMVLGGVSAWREHNLTAISGILIAIGVACCGPSIVGTLMAAMSGLNAQLNPTD
jgi:hypothetical protein